MEHLRQVRDLPSKRVIEDKQDNIDYKQNIFYR
jgi:hypothetical protein